MIYYNILEKKRKFDNNEINVTDLTNEELTEINKLYKKEIEEIQIQIKHKILKLAQNKNTF